MSELLFKKGLEESLPIASERTEGVFYVTEDTKKIVLGEAVWEDTEKVKDEIYTEIKKDEKVLAAALTELKEKKQDKLIAGKNVTIENSVISVDVDFDSANFKINDDYETVEYPNTENENVVFESIEIGSEFGDAINILEKNLAMLVNETLNNEEVISDALTKFELEKVDTVTFEAAISELEDRISNFDSTEGLDEALAEIREEINVISETKVDGDVFAEAMANLEGEFETIDETISNALTELHESVEEINLVIADLSGKTDSDHNHDELYYSKEEVNALLEDKADSDHNHDDVYATIESIDSKLDVDTFNSSMEHVLSELNVVDVTVGNALTTLNEAVEDINEVISELDNKADIDHNHDDLYITEDVLDSKGYITAADVNVDLSGLATEEYVNNKVAALVSGAPETLDTLDELAAALKDNADIVTVLENSIASKADKSEIPSLNGYATQSWVEEKNYLTEHQDISGKQDVIEDLATIRSGAEKGATALQEVPAEYVTETELNDKGYLTEHQNIDHLATKDELSGYSVTSHTHEEFTVIDQTVSNALTTLQETVEDINEVISELDNKADKSEIPSLDGYATQSWVEDKGYITAADINVDVSDKQDVINDLDEIRSGAAKGATALQEVPAEYVTETELNGKGYLTEHQSLTHLATKAELSGYAESSHTHSEFITLQNNIDNKQDKINDLATIRSGASLGATALQEVPAEYVTETELNDKGYLTEHQSLAHLATKDELSGYSVTSHTHTQYLESSDLNDYAKKSEIPSIDGLAEKTYVDNKVAALVSGAPETLDTLDELAAALKDNADIVTVLENSIGKKVDTSALTSNYYTESEVNALLNGKSDSDHTHTQYLTSADIANKQDTIDDLAAIRSGSSLGATALQSVPSEYVTETELNGKGYLTSHQNISHLATKAELSGYTTDAEFTSLSEVVNTKSNEGHTHPDYAVKTALATVATTGNYNDLSNKPTIPSEVTESTVSGWGFTKTTGTYSKPNGGIPKTDLSSDVQNSLGLADTALQSVPSEYITESELNGKNYATISQVNSKQDTISDLSTIRSNASNGATAYGWGNHADKGYVTSTSLEQTLTDYVKVNDIASESDIDSLFS